MHMVLDRVANVEDMYPFLEQVFIPSLWANNTDTNQAMDESKYLHPIDAANRMLGVARIRQVRVEETSDCEVGPMFAEYKIGCYPQFQPAGLMAPGNEAKDCFGPECVFKYSKDPLGTGYSGSLGAYGNDGYMEYLSTNRTTAMMKVQELREQGFFGLATRAVFVDFTIWSSNVGAYAVSRIAVEFGPAGTRASYLEIGILGETMLKPGGQGTPKDWCALIFVIIIMLFVLYFLAEEAQELYSAKIYYFMDGWNCLDWINMILLIIAFIQRCMVFAEAADANIGKPQLVNKDSFSSIRGIASKAESVRLLHSFNAVLLWGKCVKYFRHLPIVKVLVKTVWDAFSLFLPLLTMFSIALIGFTMAYNIGFGDKIQELTTFTRAIVYLSRSFLRDVKLMPVYYITPVFGAMLILLFYVALVLVGVQVLFAIVSDAMYRAKQRPEEENEDHTDEPLEEVGRSLHRLMLMMMKTCCPLAYRKLVKKNDAAQDKQALVAAGQLDDSKLRETAYTEDSYSTVGSKSMMGEEEQQSFTTQQIMLAIQHMSGRVLSEVQEVGIEIRSELHEICEKVAQMQMAVEELSWRAELVRREQETVM